MSHQGGLTPLMKLHLNGTQNRRISNIEPQSVEGWFRVAQSYYKTDRMPYFDIRYSLFDIRYLSAFGGFAFKVSLFDQTGPPRPAAGLTPDTRNLKPFMAKFHTR
jgi:hypothetical protein